ncbi:MAG: cysteine--tRNA ligase [Spirochaetales bacterium]|nr:cysteine--tRNA ligase [Spirochaetales bacterium]MCF7937195.1 cysteine--tRNA ligase [Spirochaetales bacterium]
MSLRLFNTLTRSVEDFVSLEAGRVQMYACGPTVYNYAHIGNLRTYIFEDLLRRTLEYLGYSVEHVMNVTDVGHLTDDADEGEDKVIRSAREQGMTVWEIAEHFTNAFFSDLDNLDVIRPTIVCKATDHIQDMIGLIERIEAKGHTYISGGNVYFDVTSFPHYGELAMLDRQNLQAGARVGVDENKRNPADFVLWFTNSKFERQAMVWDSPWGRGYPGWHIECSAMSMKYLGDKFDIHCGGVDHINVHHTNEIAQAEAATGVHPWVRYWLHGEFLVLDKDKMSKSLGNIMTLSSLTEKGYDSMDFRYFCLGGHYRSQLQFSPEALDAARSARLSLLDRIADFRRRADSVPEHPEGKAAAYLSDFTSRMQDDLHVPQALSVLWKMIKDTQVPPEQALSAIGFMDRMLGLGLIENTAEENLEEELSRLIEERNAARKNRDFERADTIREDLEKRGILLEDGPDGTRWKRKR